VFYQSYEHQYSFAIIKLTNWLESRRISLSNTRGLVQNVSATIISDL